MVNAEKIFGILKKEFAGKVLEEKSALGGESAFIAVEPKAIAEIAAFLKEHPELEFTAVHLISGVDYPEDGRIEVVYHLRSYRLKGILVLKCSVERERPALPSVLGVWRGADWLERETYDLLGVVFTGRPDLRRILMPDDWEGHPLRKDYESPETVQGLPDGPRSNEKGTETRKWT